MKDLTDDMGSGRLKGVRSVGGPVVIFHELPTRIEESLEGRTEILAEDPLSTLHSKILEYGLASRPGADAFIIGRPVIVRELKEFVLMKDRIKTRKSPFLISAIQYCRTREGKEPATFK
ncbi:MAG: hypothetical protein HY367_02055 [Candidatus Aenigmarchaeota archaeon]|nr:hypothetical protein [Candidatus Aenigmarchaeota archaeon]